jgi:hypothetical protein
LSFVVSLVFVCHIGFMYNVYTPRQIQILLSPVRDSIRFVSSLSCALRTSNCTTDVERVGYVKKMHGTNFTKSHLSFWISNYYYYYYYYYSPYYFVFMMNLTCHTYVQILHT